LIDNIREECRCVWTNPAEAVWCPLRKVLGRGRPHVEGGFRFEFDTIEEDEKILGVESEVHKNVKGRLFLQKL
jgi:hypothetical protein